MPLINYEGRELYFCEAGKGDTPLLLLPGLATDSSCWGGCYSAWLRDFKLIMPDFRGTGQTPATNHPLSFDLYADDLACILRYLGVEKSHVLGHSMGGMVALVFARKFPQLVDRLVLASSSPNSTPFASQVVRSWRRIKEQGNPEDFFNAVLPWMVTRKYFENQAMVDGAVRFFLAYPYQQSVEDFLHQLKAMRGFDFRQQLSDIEAECLIVAGDSDLMFSPQEQHEFSSMLKNSTLRIIDDMAHSPMLEKGMAFSRAVQSFLLS